MDRSTPEELKRTCQNTHITALQLFNNFLLIAESNEVQIYDWAKKNCIQKEIIFNKCSIHGIRIGDDQKVLFFGAKSIKILSIYENCNKCQVKTVAAFNLDDWILDAQWLDNEGKSRDSIAAVTAHNCLTIFTTSHSILKSIQCAENCILYSASIISCKLNSLVLAVGTVFRKILLWSPNSELDEGGRKIPFNQLTGHQGVIFSVTYSESQNIICSTSDDRSLRVWKVQSSGKEEKGSFKYWENSVINNIYVLFAHESRVWRSAILDSCILSIGEDSFLCVWSLSGKLLKKIKCHKGGSIWCLETTRPSTSNKKSTFESNETLYAFTGGSDGGVYMWDISKASQPELISQVHLHNNITFVKDFPRVCALLSDTVVNNFIVSTDKGRISKYDIKVKIWQDIFYEDSFASYCIVSVSNGNSFVALGNICGDLVLMKLQGDSAKKCASKKFKIHDSKICSLHWTNRTNHILLSCSTEGHMALWEISCENEFTIHCMHRFSLPKCKSHWWTTAALFLSCHNILVVGDRSGTISVYKHSPNSTNDSWDQPSMIHRNIHGDNGVTDIQDHSSFVYSAGRDGKVNQYIVKDGTLKLLHCIKVSHDLEWIGKIFFYNTHLLLLGFHTKDFVVWSTQLESAVMTVECGGGHRSWDFSLTDDGMATYVAIKKKEIIYYQQNLYHVLKESVLKAGISGQKFSCLTYLFTKPYSAGSMSVVACGGEDNAVRIIGIIDDQQEPSKILALNSLSGHLSSIRAIGKSNMYKTDEYLLASVGGRSQIIVWKLTDDVKGLQCEELLSDILSNSDNKVKMKSKGNQSINIDPQTRLMDVSIVHDTSSQIVAESFIIGVACSDSFFRLYKFDVNKKEILLNQIFKHGENCIQKLRTLSIKASTLNYFYMTGATSGSLKLLCNINDCHTSSSCILSNILLEDIHCHKSGINALDVKFVTDSIIMACSGGDDNSLTITFVSVDLFASGSPKVEVLLQICKIDAHASQITGVKILDKSMIVSASIDQRINVWKISYRNSIGLNLHTSALSLIPDIANLECWQTRNSCWTVAACGQGIEILTINIKEKEDDLMKFKNFFTNLICIKNS